MSTGTSACGRWPVVTEFPKAIQPVIQQFASANGCVDVWDKFVQASNYCQSWIFAQVNRVLDARRFAPGEPQASSHQVTAVGADHHTYEYTILEVCDGAVISQNGVSQKLQMRDLTTGSSKLLPLGGSLAGMRVRRLFLGDAFVNRSVLGELVPMYRLGRVQQIATNGAYVFLRFENTCGRTGVMRAGHEMPVLDVDDFCAMGFLSFAAFDVVDNALYLQGYLASGQRNGTAMYSALQMFPIATPQEIADDAAVK